MQYLLQSVSKENIHHLACANELDISQIKSEWLLTINQDGRTPLCCAVFYGHLTLAAKLFVLQPRALWIADNHGFTVLHICAVRCYYGFALSLIDFLIKEQKLNTISQMVTKRDNTVSDLWQGMQMLFQCTTERHFAETTTALLWLQKYHIKTFHMIRIYITETHNTGDAYYDFNR